ncbi:olfactory receptor 6C75-like [Bombina bombina]|uniref:olfactory receptor 6C75-like n=1 Tax=Bombina bombina TaxID=8345 RepID=UPI00235B0C83|nr:olfactory receptor 6C75-like [Bombina bombina]
MDGINNTNVKEFILLGFSNSQQLQWPLFIFILITYVICVTCNIIIIVLVKTDNYLHTPMYFFISTFAVLEIMFVSVGIPKLLTNLIVSDKRISFTSCFLQLYFLHALGETECCLLAVMAFDRDLAINNPLRYSEFMSKEFCIAISIFPWIVGFTISSIPTIVTAGLQYCGHNVLDHFMCDMAPLQNLACSNPYFSNMAISTVAVFTVVFPFFIIMGFYIHIIITICRIKSIEGKRKAFSTCSSHILVSSLFYSSVIVVYIRPKGSQYDKYLALIYTAIIPVLNPFIYTIRNKDVKKAFIKSIKQCITQWPPLWDCASDTTRLCGLHSDPYFHATPALSCGSSGLTSHECGACSNAKQVLQIFSVMGQRYTYPEGSSAHEVNWTTGQSGLPLFTQHRHTQQVPDPQLSTSPRSTLLLSQLWKLEPNRPNVSGYKRHPMVAAAVTCLSCGSAQM